MSEAVYSTVCRRDCTAILQEGSPPRHLKKGERATFNGVKPDKDLFEIIYADNTGSKDEAEQREELMSELKELGGNIAHNARLETIMERIGEILADKLLAEFGVNASDMDLEEKRKAYQHQKAIADATPPKTEQ